MEKYVIIVAGGSGSRMKSEIPKQFLLINNTPILMHTIANWYKANSSIQIILVLPQKDIQLWDELCAKYQFKNIPYLVTNGGETRFHSVKNGLELIKTENCIIAVHDGVRPFISKETIKRAFDYASEKGNAIVAVPLKDSIRKLNPDKTTPESVNRDNYRLIQTPQIFRSEVILKAYNTISFDTSITDDASVVEKAGYRIFLIDGDYSNIKITSPEDIIIAEAILSKQY